jgi:CRISPR-associated protein Csm3
MNLKFQGKYIITGKIICKTGIHIGGTSEGIEIGGIDNIVIRDPLTEFPYIPGSSLKGKLRHLLEWELNKVYPNEKGEFPVHSCENDPEIVKLRKESKSLQGPDRDKKEKELEEKLAILINQCPVCLIFGSSSATVAGTPTRLTVRDCFPTEDTINKWRQWLGENIYTELKTENTIDRVTSKANPRQMERVPAGSEFDFEMIFDIYQNEDKDLLKNLFSAMHLLENSALGGSGTRGYGKVEFSVEKQEFRSVDYYKTGKLSNPDGDKIIKALKGINSVKEIIENFPSP